MSEKPSIHGEQIQGSRDYQEDTFSINEFEDETLLLLCDGMGGHVGGKQASTLAVAEFTNEFVKHKDLPVNQRLETALIAANQAIQHKISQLAEFKGMGTTLVAVHVSDEKIYWVSVGDSPLWLIRDGQIKRLNADHSMAGVFKKLVSLGQMTAKNAANNPKRHALLSSVSGGPIEKIDLPDCAFDLHKGDCLLLASDGLETLSEQEILRLISDNTQPKESVLQLLDAVNNRQKAHQDNASVIVYQHGPVKNKRSFFRTPLWYFFFFFMLVFTLITIWLG